MLYNIEASIKIETLISRGLNMIHMALSILTKGFQNALKVIWKITKIVLPIYIIVQLLDYINVLPKIGAFLAPLMSIFGLPGETAIPLILSNFINIYAGIGALAGVDLSVKQFTILATMVTTSHSLFLETAILHGIKVPRLLQLGIRIITMILIGWLMNLIWR